MHAMEGKRESRHHRDSSPIYVHADESVPLHVHIQRPKSGSKKVKSSRLPSARSVDDYHPQPVRSKPRKPLLRPKRSASLGKETVTRSLPADQPIWIPAPGKTTKGTSPTNILESEWNIRDREHDLKPSTQRHQNAVSEFETKIDELLTEVDQFKTQVEKDAHVEKTEKRKGRHRSRERKEKVVLETKEEETETEESREDSVIEARSPGKLGVSWDIPSDPQLDDMAFSKRLIEAEHSSAAAGKQACQLLDHISCTLREGHRISVGDLTDLRRCQDDLEWYLKELERITRILTGLLRDRAEEESRRRRGAAHKDALEDTLRNLEELNRQLQEEIIERDNAVTELRLQLNSQRDESLGFANLQESLESTRGHLQKTLRQKEADCNRMSVQIRVLEGHLAQARLETEHWTAMAHRARDRAAADREALKRASRAQKQRAGRAEDTVDKLTAKLLEQEHVIGELQTDLEADRGRLEQTTEELTQLRSQRGHGASPGGKEEVERLKEENERLRSAANATETQYAEAEREVARLKTALEQYEKTTGQDSIVTELRKDLQVHETSKREALTRVQELEGQVKELESRVQFNTTDEEQTMREELEARKKENVTLRKHLEEANAALQRLQQQQQSQPTPQVPSQHVNNLEAQICQLRSELTRIRQEKEDADRRSTDRSHDLRAQLDQSEAANRSMHAYVQFLKKSYANVFGETSPADVTFAEYAGAF